MSFKELGNGLEETSASISDASVANLVRWHMNMLSGKDKKPDLPAGHGGGRAHHPHGVSIADLMKTLRQAAAGGLAGSHRGGSPGPRLCGESHRACGHGGRACGGRAHSRPDERDFFRAAHGTCGALRAFSLLCK